MSLSKQAKIDGPRYNEMITAFEGDEFRGQQIQGFGDELRTDLKKNGWIMHKQVPNERVGVSPCNRNWTMIDPYGAHELLFYISGKAWANSEVHLATAGEIAPGELGKEDRDKNVELAENSGGLLPTCNAEILEIVSVVNSHTCATLRISKSGVVRACPGHEALAGPDGIICRERIVQRSPGMAEAIDEGIYWWIVRWQILAECPKILEILSEADNAKHDSYRKETPIQCMFNIHRRASVMQGENVDYQLIAVRVSRAKDEEYQKAAKFYAKFVEAWSGGQSGVLLHQLSRFSRTLKATRTIPPEFYGMLADLKISRIGFYIIALVEASMVSPEKYMAKGVVRLFDQKELGKIVTTYKDTVLKMNKVQMEMRVLVKNMGLEDNTECFKIVANMDLRIVHSVHKKAAPGRTIYDNLMQIPKDCYDEIVAKFPEAKRCHYPWAVVVPAALTAGQPAASCGTLREMVVTRQAVMDMGFKLDVVAALKKKLDVHYKLVEMSDTTCTLQALADKKAKPVKVPLDEFIDEYKKIVDEEDAYQTHLG